MEKLKNNLDMLLRANKILLIALIAVSFTDSIVQCFINTYNNLNLLDYTLLFVTSLSFISLIGIIIAIFINLCIIISLYIKNHNIFIILISTLCLSIMNYVPASLFLSGFIPYTESYFGFLSYLISLVVSLSICYIIAYNHKHLLNLLTEQKTSILILFFSIIIGIFNISARLLSTIQEVGFYYFLLSIILAILAVLVISYKDEFRQINKINLIYLLSIIILIILSAGPIFILNPKLEAAVKKTSSFTKSALITLNTLFDFDQDGFGPQLILTGGDNDNLNPAINQAQFDYPENGIDENSFNGDLLKSYYSRYYSNNVKKSNLTGYNVIMITINNVDLPLKPDKKDFIYSFIKKSAYFPEAYATSDNKLSMLKGIYNSQISNFTTLQNSKHVIPSGKSLLKVLKANNYNTGILLDVPYSANMDFFDVYNFVDVFYANNFLMTQPVTTIDILRTVNSLSDKPYFLWVLYDTSVQQDYNKTLINLMEGLERFGNVKNTIFIINFLPKENEFKDILDIKSPYLIHHKAFQAHLFEDPVSSFDILPTILDLAGITYNTEDYIGRSLVKPMKYLKTTEDYPVFITQSDRSVSVLLDKKLFKYNLGANYKELFDIRKDPDLKKNLINTASEKELFSLMDFIISQGNSK